MNPKLKRLIIAGTVLCGFSLFAINNYLIESGFFRVRLPGLDGLIDSMREFQRRNNRCSNNQSASFNLTDEEGFWYLDVYDPQGLQQVDISNQDRSVRLYHREYLDKNFRLDTIGISDEEFIQYGELYLDIVDGCGRLEGYILKPTIVPANPQEEGLIQKT